MGGWLTLVGGSGSVLRQAEGLALSQLQNWCRLLQHTLYAVAVPLLALLQTSHCSLSLSCTGMKPTLRTPPCNNRC